VSGELRANIEKPGNFLDTGRGRAVLPMLLGFLAGVFLWYFFLIQKSKDRKAAG